MRLRGCDPAVREGAWESVGVCGSVWNYTKTTIARKLLIDSVCAMSSRIKKPNQKMQAWIDARKRYRLSHAHVQMARELGMNPLKLGGLANHRQELWKLPLPEYIEHLYEKSFGKTRPDVVLSVEERLRLEQLKKEVRRAAKLSKTIGEEPA